MTDDERLKSYERMGVSAILPGAIHLLTIIQDEVDRLRGILLGGALINGAAPKRLGRPPRVSISPEGLEAKKRASTSYWASMTPEERSEELRRRAAKRKDRAAPVSTGPGRGSYWSKMTAEERSEEMARRMSMRKKKPQNKGGAASRNHPSNPNHPGHAEWLKKMSKVGRAGWARLTPEERAERVAKQSAGHRRAA